MPEDLSDVTEQEAAVLYALTVEAVGKFCEYEAEHGARKDSAAVPRDVITWGDADVLLPGLLVMIVKAFPALHDDEYVAALVRNAAGNRPN